MILALAACTSNEGGPILFAAASTETAAVQALAETDARTSFASSSLMARQIQAGAPADLFLSAHPGWVTELEDDGLVQDREDLLTNRLVVVGSSDLDTPVTCVAVGDPDTVPLGTYTADAVDVAAIPSPVITGESASATAHLVRSGQCPVGVLYATDAGDLPVIRELESAPIVYSAAVLSPRGRELLAELKAHPEPFIEAGFTVL
ncbi:MAG: molybdate ABC transporter substrate-binding protein [Proteobacteria bacterium]|nr:molybdate ABC transporter substrate-binding protein [Pseudomonadota bacterium]MCP4915569.1 molybdate ABC transporter substrate-binding protein [Pseudomonadota bacterium]